MTWRPALAVEHAPPVSRGRGTAHWLALAAALATAGCVSGTHPAATQAGGAVFDPLAFFAGHSEGRGRLKIAFRHPEATLVEGQGTRSSTGAITLVQHVRRGDRPPTTRTWHLHATTPGHYAGTLSDADGPVAGDVAGNRLHLRFAMKGGLQAQQWLDLEPGGQVAQNVMVISKFGLPVARLDETIARMEP